MLPTTAIEFYYTDKFDAPAGWKTYDWRPKTCCDKGKIIKQAIYLPDDWIARLNIELAATEGWINSTSHADVLTLGTHKEDGNAHGIYIEDEVIMMNSLIEYDYGTLLLGVTPDGTYSFYIWDEHLETNEQFAVLPAALAYFANLITITQ